MSSETYVAPRQGLPSDWVTKLRDAVSGRDDIRAAYWLTTLYESEEGTVAQDEIHVELVDPPSDRVSVEQVRELSGVIPANGPVWAVSPRRILAHVRSVGRRVA